VASSGGADTDYDLAGCRRGLVDLHQFGFLVPGADLKGAHWVSLLS
jgi:hypothetical protein